MTPESVSHTWYVVKLQGRTIGRHALQYPIPEWETWVLSRFYSDLPSATIERDSDQRFPSQGGMKPGRFKPGPSLDHELTRLAKRHTWEALRAAIDRLEP